MQTQVSIFISYSRRDSAFVERLYGDLKAAGYDAFLDQAPNRLIAGEEWQKKLEAQILARDVFLFVVSRHSLASINCLKETEHAQRFAKRMVPLWLGDIEWQEVQQQAAWLAQIQCIPFSSTSNYADQFGRLVDELRVNLDWVRLHTSLLVRAAEWADANRNRSLLLRGDALLRAEAALAQAPSSGALSPHESIQQLILASRLAEGRRRTVTISLLALGFVVSVVVAVVSLRLSYQAQREAARARAAEQLAKQNRSAADELLDFMLGDFQAKLRPLGQLPLLDDVAGKASEYYLELAGGNQAEEVPRALWGLAEVIDYYGQISNTAAAVAAAERARTMAEPWRHNQPRSDRMDRALLLLDISTAKWQSLSGEEPLEQLQTLASEADRLLDGSPSDTDLLRFRADLADLIGTRYRVRADPDRAREAFRLGHDLRRRLYGDPPNTGTGCLAILRSMELLADVDRDVRRFRDARAKCVDMLMLARRAESLGIVATVAGERQALASERIGLLSWLAGDSADAVQPLRESIAARQTLLTRDASHVEAMRGIAKTENILGHVLLELGQLDEARQAYLRGRQVNSTLRARDATYQDYQRREAFVLEGLARIELSRFQTVSSETLRLLDDCLALRRQLVQDSPTHSINRIELVETLTHRMGASWRSRDTSGTEALLAEAQGQIDELVSVNSPRIMWARHRGVLMAWSLVMKSSHGAPGPDESRALIDWWQQLCDAYPADQVMKESLARAHLLRGALLRKNGDTTAAVQALATAEDLYRSLGAEYSPRISLLEGIMWTQHLLEKSGASRRGPATTQVEILSRWPGREDVARVQSQIKNGMLLP